MENHPEANSPMDIMTVRELAQYLRLSEAKVYRMAKTGRVPAFRIGKSWRFKKEAVDEWIRQGTGQVPFHPMDLTSAEVSTPLGTPV